MATKVGLKNEIYKFSDEERENLYLLVRQRRGCINIIAERTGYTRESIRLIFRGKVKSSLPQVMKVATSVLEEYNIDYKKTMAALNKLSANAM